MQKPYSRLPQPRGPWGTRDTQKKINYKKSEDFFVIFTLFSSFADKLTSKQFLYQVKKHRRHIIAIVVTALISVTLYAARTNSDRLSLLQPLLEYNHPFSPDAPVDSIIAWEKLLEPELQKEQQYPLLFQINLLTVQALITEGNISLAINQANQMYQKAREMDYPWEQHSHYTPLEIPI